MRSAAHAEHRAVLSREALLRGVQSGVAAAVAAAWFELRGIEAELAVAADISQSQRESLGLVERLVRAGSAIEFDRLRAEALLHHVEMAAPELERRRAASNNALATLLGETPQTFRPPSATPAPEALAVRTIAVGNPAALLSRRADIAAAERTLAAATARIGVATAGLYPEVQVQGSIGLVAGSLDAMSGAGALSGLLGPVIRWSLLDTGRVRARIAASEARTKEALIAYDRTVLRALQETDDAFKAYGAARSTLGLRCLSQRQIARRLVLPASGFQQVKASTWMCSKPNAPTLQAGVRWQALAPTSGLPSSASTMCWAAAGRSARRRIRTAGAAYGTSNLRAVKQSFHRP